MALKLRPETDQATAAFEREAAAEGAAARAPVQSDQELGRAPLVTTGPTTTVACKLPHGVVLQLYEMVTVFEPVMGGGSRETRKAVPLPGKSVTLSGAANPVNQPARRLTYGGYGLTYGVPLELWEAWCEANHDSPLLERGLIFAVGGDVEDAKLEAIGRKEVRSGLEAIDVSADMVIDGVKIARADDRHAA